MCKLTGLDIYVGKKGLTNGVSLNENNHFFTLRGLFKRILNWIFGRSFGNNSGNSNSGNSNPYNSSNPNPFGFGDLVIEIYSKLGNSTIKNRVAYVTLSPDEISEDGGWIHIDLDNIKLRWNGTYYIVVYHDRGNSKRFYYKWYYGAGDPYSRGSSYSTGYPWDWKEDKSKDFCFRTYGEPTGDEPDGVVERWGVLIGVLEDVWGDICYFADNDAYDMRDVLLHHGWQEDHIKVLISPTGLEIMQAIKWLDSVDDGDDIDIFMITSHGRTDPDDPNGGIIGTNDGWLYYYQLDEWLDECDGGQLVVIDACESGSAIWDMAQEGRVVLTSSGADQYSYGDTEMKNNIFIYFLADETGVWSSKHGYPTPRVGKDGAFARDDPDTNEEYGGNNDGWISAEEAFSYAKKWTVKATIDPNTVPQISDNYNGDLLIAKRI